MALAVPVMISQLGHVMVGIADSAMVGRLGAEALAASSLANSMFFLILVFGIGITFGMTPLVAQADSDNKPLFGAMVFKNGMFINAITGLLLFGLVWAGSYLTPYLGQEDAVSQLCEPYLRVVNVSGLFFIAFQTFRQFAEGMSRTVWAMALSIGVNLINIGLNYLFIFGYGPIPAMGLMGAGYATLIARFLMALVMAWYVLKHPHFRVIMQEWKNSFLEWATMQRILNIGIPSGLQYLFEIGAFAIAAVMIGWLGAEALAAHQIALSIAAATYMLASGIAAASTVRIGNHMGTKDYLGMRQVALNAFGISGGIMAFAGLIFVLFNQWLPTLFIEETEVIVIASELLLIAALFQIADGIQAVGLGIQRGMEDTKTPTIITLTAYWVLALPLAYFFGFLLDWGIHGVWVGLASGLGFAAIGLFLRFQLLSKKIIIEANHGNS